MRRIFLHFLFLLMILGEAHSFNPWTHIWLGLKPEFVQFWRDFGDNEFADSLESPTDFRTKKFYLIGLMLPDFVDTLTQYHVRGLIKNLYNLFNGGDTTLIYSPFNILASVYDEVDTPFYFIGNPPNTNLEKLWEMVNYAKSMSWSPFEKSLIYGSYMHVIQDLYGHMVFQPSIYGYGKQVESPDSLNRNLLFQMENLYELFTPTFISTADAETLLTMLFSEIYTDSIFIYSQEDSLISTRILHGCRRTPFSFYSEKVIVYRVHPAGNDSTYAPYVYSRDWDVDGRDGVLPPFVKFVEAANHVNYADETLTPERLEAYTKGVPYVLYPAMYLIYHPHENIPNIFQQLIQIITSTFTACELTPRLFLGYKRPNLQRIDIPFSQLLEIRFVNNGLR